MSIQNAEPTTKKVTLDNDELLHAASDTKITFEVCILFQGNNNMQN